MNLINNYFKVCFLIFSMTWSLFSFAAPVTWQLLFSNNAGQSVGNGQFTYDPSTSICIERSPTGCQRIPLGGFEDTTVLLDGFEVTTILDSISIDLVGLNWGNWGSDRGLSGRSWWYDEPSITPGSQLISRISTSIVEVWEFSDGPLTQFEMLFMSNFTKSTETSWTGDWDVRLISTNTGEWTTFGGGFTVTSEVPAPGAILLFSSGLIVLASRKKFRYR